MTSKKRTLGIVLGILAVVLVVLLGLVLWWLFVDTAPGGPIIVIQPEPDGYAGGAPATLAPYTTRWFAGCPTFSGLPLEAKEDPALDEIPSKYFRFTGAQVVEIALQNPTETVIVREALLTLDGNRELVIKHVKADKVPEWRIGDRGLWGKGGVKEPNWPKELFGVITDTINVTDDKGQFTKIPRDRLVSITIRFNHFGPYNRCP